MKSIYRTQKRIESKYISNSVEINHFLLKSLKFGFRKEFQNRSVYSLYYDDNFLSAVRDNISGITPRSKYRLRWYRYSDNNDFGWRFEKKNKIDKFGFKEIQDLPPNFNLKDNNYSIKNIKKIVQKSNPSLFSKNLYPKLYCNYSRDYYCLRNGVRLTIDSKMRFRRFNSNEIFEQNIGWQHSNYNILEFKFCPSQQNFIINLLKSLPKNSTRCSKYLLGQSKLNGISYL